MTRPAPASAVMAALLSEVVDDAGLFPPAALPLDDALAAHAAAKQGDFSWMLGRFVCPAARAADVPAEVRVCVVASSLDEAHAAASRREVEAVELRPATGPVAEAARALAGASAELGVRDAFLEVPPEAEAVRALAGTGVGAKLRCGGVTADAFPGVEALADALAAAASAGVRVKATAGLHHPIRHWDEGIGVQMHGFLNLAAAIVAADAGADVTEVEKVLREENASGFVLGDDRFGWGPFLADAASMRRLREVAFAGFGSCSFDEPVQDLIDLGVLAPVG